LGGINGEREIETDRGKENGERGVRVVGFKGDRLPWLRQITHTMPF